MDHLGDQMLLCGYLHRTQLKTDRHFARTQPSTRTPLLVIPGSAKNLPKTYNSGYSLVVTHLTTNPPVRCLNRAERTGSLVFNVLWSYVSS